MRHSFLTLSIVCALAATSCKDDAPQTPAHTTGTTASGTDSSSTSTPAATTLEANRFVNDVMGTYYYWNEEMPPLDYRKQTDTEKYFYSLLSSKDRFSYISQDAATTNNEFSGIYTAFGWEYTLSYYGSGDDVVAIITYVSDNSPASRAGARRGDVIRSVDGTTITASNYSRVFVNATSGTFSGFHGASDVSYTMTRENITVNPVAGTAVFDLSNGKRAGYLLYNSYSSAFNSDMASAFSKLKDEGVSEMILDLRYNTGGSMDACTVMASILAPEDAARGKKEMLYYDYNSGLQSLGYTRDNTAENFTDTLVNMGLSRVVVLTGRSTYSASEATILSLQAYMDVTLIGDTTGGKNSMMYVLSPMDFTNRFSGEAYYSESINNWLVMPICAIFYNSNGQTFDTSSGRGMAPDFYANDYEDLATTGLKELGDPDETLTAAAIEFLETGAVGQPRNKALTRKPRLLGSSADGKPKLLYREKKAEP